jgi:hypothetical protein
MISYRYIPASIEEAKVAWLEFQATGGNSYRGRQEAQFIPAAGGCFVVVELTGSRWDRLRMLLGTGGVHALEQPCRQLLDAFALFWSETWTGSARTNHSEA